jgi:hypothetical protein
MLIKKPTPSPLLETNQLEKNFLTGVLHVAKEIGTTDV